MAKVQIHGILSELHRLLSSYRAADFIEASRYSGISPRMKEVLLALSREANPEQRAERARPSAFGSLAPERTRAAESTHADRNSSGISEVVRRSPEFQSNRDMLMFARSLGLKLLVNPKDSRDRVARRLSALIEKMPEDRKKEVVAALLAGRSTQTQGWIDVIKSANQ